MLICAGLLAGCQTMGNASECDGWQRQTPSAKTRQYLIANDRPFAVQVGSHNRHGERRGCWKAAVIAGSAIGGFME